MKANLSECSLSAALYSCQSTPSQILNVSARHDLLGKSEDLAFELQYNNTILKTIQQHVTHIYSTLQKSCCGLRILRHLGEGKELG